LIKVLGVRFQASQFDVVVEEWFDVVHGRNIALHWCQGFCGSAKTHCGVGVSVGGVRHNHVMVTGQRNVDLAWCRGGDHVALQLLGNLDFNRALVFGTPLRMTVLRCWAPPALAGSPVNIGENEHN
jgi:hypothetical protein